MKLSDVKERIDNFFDNITPEELYKLSLRYGFKEVKEDDDEVLDISDFENNNQMKYVVLEVVKNYSYSPKEEDEIRLAEAV